MPKKIKTLPGPAVFAVLLIDMQDGFVLSLNPDDRDKLVTKQKRLIRECARLDIPLIVFEYLSYGDTLEELMSEASKVPRHWLLHKNVNTGFYRTGLQALLKDLKVNTLVLTGINASYCVLETAESAIKKGYKIVTGENFITNCSCRSCQAMGKSRAWFAANGTFHKKSISLSRIVASR